MRRLKLDKELCRASFEKLVQMGYPLHNEATMKATEPYVKLGSTIAIGLYPNIKDRAVQVFVTAYTAIATIIDDTFADNPGPITEFSDRFMRGVPQEDPTLEVFARFLHGFRDFWNPVMADMLLQSSLMFITSVAIEHGMKDAEVSVWRRLRCCNATQHPIVAHLQQLRASAVSQRHVRSICSVLPLDVFTRYLPEYVFGSEYHPLNGVIPLLTIN